MTAYYNVYFNGKESYKEGEQKIIDNFDNNYNLILLMFEASDLQAAQSASSEMDRAIQKGSRLITKHSITAKPKNRPNSKSAPSVQAFYNQNEFNKWVDDAFLLIGKAQVNKHEFHQSIRTFDHIVREFGDKPIKYEALIWKARAFAELGDYSSALAALETYDMDGKAPVGLYGQYMAVYADVLLKQGKNNEAVPYLKAAIEGAVKKDRKARYQFILGQIYLNLNQESLAAAAFGNVLKLKPDYEMAFNAKVERAAIMYQGASFEEIKKQIHKLLKDKKNEDFQDQIYYALGKAYLNQGDKSEAIANFKLSVAKSVGNDYQKGLSYLEVGEVYFNDENFKQSFFYYDTAFNYINEEYKDFKALSERRLSLDLLVKQLDLAGREDSLQMIADMSETDRNDFLDSIIKDQEEQLRLAKEKKREEFEDDAFFYQNSGTMNGPNQVGGKWYFYNVNSVSMGKQEFEKRWGKRKLENNWRRKDKSSVEISTTSPDDMEDPFADSADLFTDKSDEDKKDEIEKGKREEIV